MLTRDVQVVGLYRHLLASHILIKRAHLVAADLAMDSAAGSLGYRQVHPEQDRQLAWL